MYNHTWNINLSVGNDRVIDPSENDIAKLSLTEGSGVFVRSCNPFSFSTETDDRQRMRAPGGGFFGDHIPKMKEFEVEMDIFVQKSFDSSNTGTLSYTQKVEELVRYFHPGREGRLIWQEKKTGGRQWFIQGRVVDVDFDYEPEDNDGALSCTVMIRAADPYIYKGNGGAVTAWVRGATPGGLSGSLTISDDDIESSGAVVYPTITFLIPSEFNWTGTAPHYNTKGSRVQYTDSVDNSTQRDYYNSDASYLVTNSRWEWDLQVELPAGRWVLDQDRFTLKGHKFDGAHYNSADDYKDVDTNGFEYWDYPQNRFALSGFLDNNIGFRPTYPSMVNYPGIRTGEADIPSLVSPNYRSVVRNPYIILEWIPRII